ncbi:MAG: hypothetical protein Q8T08_08100, partial [Ignavibacteria bacterium]|nr:hypothetical protein [Ignavibacteria bacterium]
MKYYLPKRRINFILFVLVFLAGSFSFLKSKKPGIPADVVKVIDETGVNRIEFTKTIAKYFESTDSLKTKAAYFLIANIGRQYSVDYEIVDSNGNAIAIDPMLFNSAESFLANWKVIQDSLGELTYEARKYFLDRDTITSELLIASIENTFESRSFSWTKTYSDEDIFHYVLPYRIGNETIEDWRTHIRKEFTSLIDTAKTLDSPEQIADLVNEYVNRNYHFDKRFISSPQTQAI